MANGVSQQILPYGLVVILKCLLNSGLIFKAIMILKLSQINYQTGLPMKFWYIRQLKSERTGIQLSVKQRNELTEISTFNIEARYDDYKLSFYKKANKRFTSKYVNKTRKILKWLNNQL